MLVVSGRDLKAWLDMKTAVSIAEAFFKDYSPEKYRAPQRTVIPLPERDAVWLNMPALSLPHRGYVIKVINEYRQNPARYGLETANGVILYFDVETGVLKGLVDAVYLTALRTGAIGGVGANYMARSGVKAVGIVGSGRVAWALLEAMKAVRDIESVKVFSPNRVSREKMAERAERELGLEAVAVNSPRDAVLKADAVIAATNSAEPVFSGEWLDSNVHVTSMGALPTRRELDLTTFQRAKIIAADLREAVLKEAGDLIAAVKEGVIETSRVTELHEIVKTGRMVRDHGEMITLLKSVGFAAIDLFFAVEVFSRAEKQGVGRWVEFQ
ncbi:MAG: ornithine cyclodeaminase family protein [Candidatus Caldarchaeum sp.]|uniref:Ornithine cyclodeaminase family protein n=1 Tax=Caldiarchaeum subterraneum TaxID=311458 RepID=A0A7C5LAW5_CALS0